MRLLYALRPRLFLLPCAFRGVPPAHATANEASPDTIKAAIVRRLAVPGNVLRTAPEAWAGKAAAAADQAPGSR